MPLNRELMDNPRATRVKHITELASRKGRKRARLFLVEGPQAVREAIGYAANSVRDVYVDENWRQSRVLRDIVNSAMDSELYVHEATSAVMDTLSQDCQGICAVVQTEAVLSEVADLDIADSSLIAACWQLRDPGNAGTIIRAADASGCAAVVLVDECVDVTNPKVVRSTAGSLFHVPIASMTEEDFFAWSRSQNALMTAADVYGTDKTPVTNLQEALATTDFQRMQIVLFGNEARGLTPELIDSTDRAVAIPLYGNAESLNVAISASIMLYAFALRAHE
ncbi:TrmH family RNA methyltransferase [Alloscardovia venturai]|uniref:TrmH family RNA methyltransferase n=1 Tax=Alloscardovia venturai TaxID=1769421 RepID=A0ABW2YAV2_9BIFI